MRIHNPKVGALDSVDALLLCGEGAGSRKVLGDSKIFLPIDGKPLFIHVLDALSVSRRVRRIFVVGDKQRLETAIGAEGIRLKPVTVIAQGRNLLENIFRGFTATLDGYTEGAERENPDFARRVILGLAGDSPLITPEEIDDFIGEADMNELDYAVGLTPASSLDRFRPAEGRPGIRMSSFHFREGRFRISNLHLARPFAFANRDVAQKLYESRYQREFLNVLRLMGHILAMPGVRRHIWLYLALQVCLTLSRIGLPWLADKLRGIIPSAAVADAVSQITGARAGIVITRRGGAALDIDNEADYRAMSEMFSQWKTTK